jgi:hypothetical protein
VLALLGKPTAAPKRGFFASHTIVANIKAPQTISAIDAGPCGHFPALDQESLHRGKCAGIRSGWKLQVVDE